jgi:hypothetical protein
MLDMDRVQNVTTFTTLLATGGLERKVDFCKRDAHLRQGPGGNGRGRGRILAVLVLPHLQDPGAIPRSAKSMLDMDRVQSVTTFSTLLAPGGLERKVDSCNRDVHYLSVVNKTVLFHQCFVSSLLAHLHQGPGANGHGRGRILAVLVLPHMQGPGAIPRSAKSMLDMDRVHSVTTFSTLLAPGGLERKVDFCHRDAHLRQGPGANGRGRGRILAVLVLPHMQGPGAIPRSTKSMLDMDRVHSVTTFSTLLAPGGLERKVDFCHRDAHLRQGPGANGRGRGRILAVLVLAQMQDPF